MRRPTRFALGDIVELPDRLTKDGGREGVVVHSRVCGDGIERSIVQREVRGRLRHTVVPEDKLFRLGCIEVQA